MLVRDSDPQCIPGAEVQVSKRWQDVPYFKQFHGVRGKLTRRGVTGATWYAAFTGCPEQAFSTGMHGQYILCYAPVRLHAWQYMHCVHGRTCPAIILLGCVHALLLRLDAVRCASWGRYARSAPCATCLLPYVCVVLLRTVFPTRDGAHAYLRSGP